MSHTGIPAASRGGSKAHRGCLRKLFMQLAQPARLHGAKPRRQGVIGDSGAAVVEFALSASMLLTLLIGIMFVCLALYSRHVVSEAAQAGARWAMVRGSASCTNTPNLADCDATAAEIQTYVKSLSYPGIVPKSLTVTPTWCSLSGSTPATWTTCSSSTSNKPGNAVQVVVSYPFSFTIPFLKANTFTFSSTSQLVIAQ